MPKDERQKLDSKARKCVLLFDELSTEVQKEMPKKEERKFVEVLSVKKQEGARSRVPASPNQSLSPNQHQSEHCGGQRDPGKTLTGMGIGLPPLPLIS